MSIWIEEDAKVLVELGVLNPKKIRLINYF